MINNVTLVGRLTRDPELKYIGGGTAVASFNLAVNRNFTNQTGEREADFINCVIWRKPAETLANYARKGTLLGITGRIQTRSYDNQQGQKVYVTEIVAENFQLLEKKDNQNSPNNADTGFSSQSNTNNQNDNYNGNRATSGGQNNAYDQLGGTNIDISDDDLPF